MRRKWRRTSGGHVRVGGAAEGRALLGPVFGAQKGQHAESLRDAVGLVLEGAASHDHGVLGRAQFGGGHLAHRRVDQVPAGDRSKGARRSVLQRQQQVRIAGIVRLTRLALVAVVEEGKDRKLVRHW